MASSYSRIRKLPPLDVSTIYILDLLEGFGSILFAGTTQACLFRDEFTPLTATGYSIFGLSSDSPKSNTTFKTKQNLPYTLLCDPNATLTAAIGMKKAPKGTVRGVFVVSKAGTVEAAEPGVRIPHLSEKPV